MQVPLDVTLMGLQSPQLTTLKELCVKLEEMLNNAYQAYYIDPNTGVSEETNLFTLSFLSCQ